MIDTSLVQTKTINLSYVNKILSNCPNYDKIVNYEYEYGDTLSSKLIDWYRELVFSCDGESDNQLKIIYLIDHSLALYVGDSQYKRRLSRVLTKDEINLDNSVLIQNLIKKIVEFTNRYEKDEILELVNNKWL